MENLVDKAFWKNKRVFITGHTGFKGAWLSFILGWLGARVTGFALPAPTAPSLFELCGLKEDMPSVYGDIRHLAALRDAISRAAPEIVIHMAAQPIVRDSYSIPVLTYETNVMGTVHILECIRLTPNVKSFLNVTTDKVYRNNEWDWGYRESDPLGGYDPYSNSKSCSELVTQSYRQSFFTNCDIALSTARSGNVIGGGDFAKDRIIPDCIRASFERRPIIVRNPHSVRPYQHVLEPLFAYLMILQRQYDNLSMAGEYNIGPNDEDCVSTGTLAEMFCRIWGDGQTWENRHEGGPHEAGVLRLDCARLKSAHSWHPRWSIETAVRKTVEWAKARAAGRDPREIMLEQLQLYLKETPPYDV